MSFHTFMVKGHRFLECAAFVFVVNFALLSVIEQEIVPSLVRLVSEKYQVLPKAGTTDAENYEVIQELQRMDNKKMTIRSLVVWAFSCMFLLIAFSTIIVSLSLECIVLGALYFISGLAHFAWKGAYALASMIATSQKVWEDGSMTQDLPYDFIVHALYIAFLAVPFLIILVLYYRHAKRRGLL